MHKLPKRLMSGLSRLCASWVNPGVTDSCERETDRALFGGLFALPVTAAASTALMPMAWNDFASFVPGMTMAFAVPMLSAGWLSLTGSKAARKLLSTLMLPALYLAATHGQDFHTQAALVAGAVAGLAWRYKLVPERNVVAGMTVTALLGLTAALPVAAASTLLGALGFVLAKLDRQAAGQVQPQQNPSDFDVVAKLLPAGSILIETGRDGKVNRVAGATTIKPASNLLDSIHIGDRVAFLTALDGISAGLVSDQQIEVRMLANENPGGARAYAAFNLSIARLENKLVVSAFSSAVGTKDETDAGFGPIAMVSHEMRTPLNAIIGFSDLLEKGLIGELANERQREYVELINRSGRHLLDVVNTMLDMSKLKNGTFAIESEPFLPDELANLAVNMLAKQAQARHIGLEYLPSCVFEAFHGDRRMCQQILVNLLSNAVKFTPDGGKVGLMVDIDQKGLTIEVSDNGIGMSSDEVARAGTPFFQANSGHSREFEGTGLGLALVRKMTELHGGAMEIESEPGRGTRVRVTLVENRKVSANSLSNLAILRPQSADESVRLISLNTDELNDTPRKTA